MKKNIFYLQLDHVAGYKKRYSTFEIDATVWTMEEAIEECFDDTVYLIRVYDAEKNLIKEVRR